MDPLLSALHGAIVEELTRQSTGGQGFQPPSSQTPDSVSYFDGGFRVTPVIVAMLAELRKLPDARIGKAIDTALAAAQKA